MQYINTLTRSEDTVKVTYHWNRSDPEKSCDKIKSLTVEEEDKPSGPDGPETAKSVVLAMEVATIQSGVEIIQGPWDSMQQARETLQGLIESSHPDFHQTFAHCRECLF
jgi:hypothetical protein